jgi:hypothetical protein
MHQSLATQQAAVQQQVSAPTSAEKPKRARALNFEVTGPIHAALADRDLLPATHLSLSRLAICWVYDRTVP